MPIPEQRNLDDARKVLRDWFAAKLPDASDLELGPLAGPASTGFSNETLIFDATWNEGGTPGSEGFVVRVKPTEHTVFLESDFESQYRVMRALSDHTDVPLAPLHWFEADESVLGAPYFVMGKVEGWVPGDSPFYTQAGWFVDEATPAQREALSLNGLAAMQQIHSADVDALGLRFLDKPQYGKPGLDQQINYYEAAFEWATRGPNRIADAAREWVRANRPSSQEDLCLAWGDARINNQMFGPDQQVIAVFDWEMTTLADPMMDLGWWLFLDRHFHDGIDVARQPGFPTRERMVERYEELSGAPAHDLEFYEVFAGLRFAVVMMRIATLLVDFEVMPADADLAENNTVTIILADLLGLPRPGA